MKCIVCQRSTRDHNNFCSVCEPLSYILDSIGIDPSQAFNKNINKEYKRLDERDTFLAIALLISRRSPDSQTQHGCVLVKNRRIIATGYNGWNSGSNDLIIPNTRPHKYNFVIHAELNAILNAAKEGVSVEGATAYITGMPCTECAKALIQCGIKNWYLGNVGHSAQNDKKQQLLLEFLIRHHNVFIDQNLDIK